MKKTKVKTNSKGITLIALVVTIVVLLILAGISINLVLGNNGIIAKAKDAKSQTEQARANDEAGMNGLYDEMEQILNGNNGGQKPPINPEYIVTLKPRDTWYQSILATRAEISEIHFVKELPTEQSFLDSIVEEWDPTIEEEGKAVAVIVNRYATEVQTHSMERDMELPKYYEIYISTKGAEGIAANEDSSYAFSNEAYVIKEQKQIKASEGSFRLRQDGCDVALPFSNTNTIDGLELLNTSKINTMSSMFAYFGAMPTPPNRSRTQVIIPLQVNIRGLSRWDTSNVVDMSWLFCKTAVESTGFNIDTLSEWNTSGVKDMRKMFYGTYGLSPLMQMEMNENVEFTGFDVGDLSKWNVSNVEDMAYMFSTTGVIEEMLASTHITDNRGQSGGGIPKLPHQEWNVGDLSNWKTSNVKCMYKMFFMSGVLDHSYTIGDLTKWDVSNVTDMSYMFGAAGSASKSFNIGNLKNWKVNNVTDMSYMFNQSGVFSEEFYIGDLSEWNVSNVTNMSAMFGSAGSASKSFNIGNLKNWKVDNVTDMSYMFYQSGIFSEEFYIGDLSEWNVSNVTNMNNMFAQTGIFDKNFSQDLSSWDVSKVISHEGFQITEEGQDNIIEPNWVN